MRWFKLAKQVLPGAKNWWTLLHNAARSSRPLFKCRIMQEPEWAAHTYDGSLHFVIKFLPSGKYWTLELWSPHIIGAGKYGTLRLTDFMGLVTNSMKQNYLLLVENFLISCMQQKLTEPYDLFIIAWEMHLNCFETPLFHHKDICVLLQKMHVFVAEGSKPPDRAVYCLL